ncbi:hypothetical protein [Poseidonocella sp. HB161398]|uniref:hypothetical protein n=1 Tax=Poseidonocella sp. HB161398 TaxID=2320855 RepID=UPI001F116864|nr:hypothetical protein [Poseidonocella sp. HB161398]
MEIAELQTAEGRRYLFLAIGRTGKAAAAQPAEKAGRRTAWEVLEFRPEAVPCRIRTIPTERAIGPSPMASGIQVAEQPRNRNTAQPRQMRLDMIRKANGIENRLAKPDHPCSHEDQETVRGTVFPRGGQVGRMNRTVKDATVKRFRFGSHDQLRSHLADVLNACNVARRLKTLSGPTPCECICRIRASEPHRVIAGPIHQMPGLNS